MFALYIGHFQHGIFDVVDFTRFRKPGVIDENVTGSAGQATAALAFDMRYIVRGSGFHQVETVFDVGANLVSILGFPGNIGQW